jgi:hypothetical protein
MREWTDEYRRPSMLHPNPPPAKRTPTACRPATSRRWGQIRVLRAHPTPPQVGPEQRRTAGPDQSATATGAPRGSGPGSRWRRLPPRRVSDLRGCAARGRPYRMVRFDRVGTCSVGQRRRRRGSRRRADGSTDRPSGRAAWAVKGFRPTTGAAGSPVTGAPLGRISERRQVERLADVSGNPAGRRSPRCAGYRQAWTSVRCRPDPEGVVARHRPCPCPNPALQLKGAR